MWRNGGHSSFHDASRCGGRKGAGQERGKERTVENFGWADDQRSTKRFNIGKY